jgi:hypothetical protein
MDALVFAVILAPCVVGALYCTLKEIHAWWISQ